MLLYAGGWLHASLQNGTVVGDVGGSLAGSAQTFILKMKTSGVFGLGSDLTRAQVGRDQA